MYKHFLRRSLGHVDGGSPSPLQVCLHAQHIIRLFLVIVPHYSLQPTQVSCILSTQSLIDSCLHSQSHKLSPPPQFCHNRIFIIKKRGKRRIAKRINFSPLQPISSLPSSTNLRINISQHSLLSTSSFPNPVRYVSSCSEQRLFYILLSLPVLSSPTILVILSGRPVFADYFERDSEEYF